MLNNVFKNLESCAAFIFLLSNLHYFAYYPNDNDIWQSTSFHPNK